MKNLKITMLALLISLVWTDNYAQSTVAAGINYQAVARDNSGRELAGRNIDVKFSIISENPLGDMDYQEIHTHVTTSKYGVFSLIIGKGTPTGGIYSSFTDVDWGQSDHYLKVEVRFANDFIDMGTMQFMAVPYALYAQKSLEPGPPGPKGDPGEKGDPGDPASDNQNLSFDQSNLTISNGNSVPLTSLLQNLTITNSAEGNYLGISRGNSVLLATVEADGDPANELQDLVYDATGRKLSLLKSTAPAIDLSELKNDADADPTNEIQDLILNSNKLTITNKTSPTQIDLAAYIQSLTFTPADNKLQISGGNTVDLSSLKQDLNLTGNILKITNNTSATSINLASYLDNTDNQTLSFNQVTNTLSLTNGGSVTLENLVAFKAKKNTPTITTINSNKDFSTDGIEYNDGSCFNESSNAFFASSAGLYSFEIEYNVPSNGAGQKIMLYKNDAFYATLESNLNNGNTLIRSVNIKLSPGDWVRFVIYTALSTEVGTGSFSGYRVY